MHTVDLQFRIKRIDSTAGVVILLSFLLLMHLCVMYNELYCPRKEIERLPGRIPSPFAKMINLAPQMDRSPYSVELIAAVCLDKQVMECLYSQ